MMAAVGTVGAVMHPAYACPMGGAVIANARVNPVGLMPAVGSVASVRRAWCVLRRVASVAARIARIRAAGLMGAVARVAYVKRR